jgi:curved DNA-binding protein CbpA
MALITHPDKNNGLEGDFIKVNLAYHFLLENKAIYDVLLS